MSKPDVPLRRPARQRAALSPRPRARSRFTMSFVPWHVLRRPGARRAGWAFVDQALSSATNVAVNVVVARTVSTQAFGAYSLIFATYLLLMGVSRSLFTQPMVIRHTGAGDHTEPEVGGAVLGGALGIGVVAGVVAAVVALLVGPDFAPSLWAFAAVLPGLMVQDASRFVFFAGGVPARAAFNDGVWVLAQVVAFTALFVSGMTDVHLLVLAWGGSATVAAAVACMQLGGLPRPSAVVPWLRQHRDLGVPFLGDMAVNRGTDQAPAYALPVVADLAAAGVLRAGQLLFGPLNFFGQSLLVSALPEGVRLRRRSPAALRAGVVGLALLLAGAAVLVGVALLLLPDRYGEQVLGATWELARVLIVPLTVQRAAQATSESALAGLQVLEQGQRIVRVRVALAGPFLAMSVGGAAIEGARGAAIGMAAGAVLSMLVWWWQFGVASRAALGDDLPPQG